jgi:hypothetical protein
MNIQNSAGGRASDLKQIRNRLDTDDLFFSGHRVRKACGPNGKHIGSRGRKIAEWATTDKGIQKVLLRAFPKLGEDLKQRLHAARWARVIFLYFRMGYTYSRIAEEMNLRSPNEKRPYTIIENLIAHILRVARGESANGSGNLGRKRGRPKKIRDVNEASFRGSSQ